MDVLLIPLVLYFGAVVLWTGPRLYRMVRAVVHLTRCAPPVRGCRAVNMPGEC